MFEVSEPDIVFELVVRRKVRGSKAEVDVYKPADGHELISKIGGVNSDDTGKRSPQDSAADIITCENKKQKIIYPPDEAVKCVNTASCSADEGEKTCTTAGTKVSSDGSKLLSSGCSQPNSSQSQNSSVDDAPSAANINAKSQQLYSKTKCLLESVESIKDTSETLKTPCERGVSLISVANSDKERSKAQTHGNSNQQQSSVYHPQKKIAETDANSKKRSDMHHPTIDEFNDVSGIDEPDFGPTCEVDFDMQDAVSPRGDGDSTSDSNGDVSKTQTASNSKILPAENSLSCNTTAFSQTKKDSKHDVRWKARYDDLVAYKLEHGNCKVTEDMSPTLRNWIGTQLYEFKKGCITEGRVAKLNEIGLLSAEETRNYKRTKAESPYEKRMRENWDRKYSALRAYVLEHGRSISTDHPLLTRWICFQRKEYRNNNMSAERIAKLNDICMLTAPRRERKKKENQNEMKWNSRYASLKSFKKLHGHFNVPHSIDEKLGKWKSLQISNFRKGTISGERMKKLKEIGLLTDDLLKTKGEEHETAEARWDRYFDELKKYKLEFGDCNVKPKLNPGLNIWTQRQRSSNNRGELSDDRYDKLVEIGFSFKSREDKWNECYSLLMEFKEINGHCNVPRDYATKQLVKWVSYQRERYKIGKLRDERIAQLDDIGFVWEDQMVAS